MPVVVERSWELRCGCLSPGSVAYLLCDLPQIPHLSEPICQGVLSRISIITIIIIMSFRAVRFIKGGEQEMLWRSRQGEDSVLKYLLRMMGLESDGKQGQRGF